jgi:hypothetical protein
MKVPGLRSSYEKVGGIVYFGRMLDKIRLHASGRLPEGYNLGYPSAPARSRYREVAVVRVLNKPWRQRIADVIHDNTTNAFQTDERIGLAEDLSDHDALWLGTLSSLRLSKVLLVFEALKFDGYAVEV